MSDLTKFAELGLSEKTLVALEKKGFEEPSAIQKQCIPLLLKDQADVIGQAQTGTGKTAAFGLPILEIVDEEDKRVQALILAPTRELAIQVADEINSLKGNRRIEIMSIYGGASMDQQLRKLRRGAQIVVGTPGRILDHLRRKTLKLDNLKFAVLDEADEMLDMGFIDDIETILSDTPDEKRMLCFSATMPAPIMRMAQKFMDNPQIVRVEKKDLTSSLTDQIYFEVRERDKFEALCRLIDMEEDFYGLIFCRTKVQCDEVGRRLQERGFDAEALHGDLSQSQREKILKRMKDHLLSIVVATDVAARGIDINDLSHVINFSIPQDPEAYIHRVGRTGRAGKLGTAVTFITPQEFRKFKNIKRVSNADIRKEEVPAAEDVINIKKDRIHDKLMALIAGDETYDQFLPLANEMLLDNDASAVLAALLSHFYKEDLDSSRYRNIGSFSDRGRDDRGFRDDRGYRDDRGNRHGRLAEDGEHTRLFIARGRKDGLDPKELVAYLKEKVGASDSDIQDVAVRDAFSFVTAPFKVAEEIISVLNATSDGDRPVVSKAKSDNPNDRNMNRGGGRGGDRRRRDGGGERRNFGRRDGGGSRRDGGRGRRSESRSNFEEQPYGRDERQSERPSISWDDENSGSSRGRRSNSSSRKSNRRR